MTSAYAVAKEFVRLSRSGDEPEPMTGLRLQRLLYLAQGWHFAIREANLFADGLQAWRYGPVVPAVYASCPRETRDVGEEAFADAPGLDPERVAFIRAIWEAYLPYTATQLARMTQERGPWNGIRCEKPDNGEDGPPIPDSAIAEFFRGEAIPAPLAAYASGLRERERAALASLESAPPLDFERFRELAVGRPGR